jgi:predicted glutamine amidotransferase
MCGIFGMVSRKPKPFNKRAFYTMGVRNDSRGGDSCGVFIDGLVEYGVDKKKTFMSFFRESLVLANTSECKVALGHCRKASVGKISLETAQPVVLTNEQGNIEYVLIHNGTIHNYEALAKKYIPDIDIQGLTDSQVMARIFYHKGYDALNEYHGGAVFVIHDYRIDKTYVWKGESRKSDYYKAAEEERPLFYCWHNGRFVFSSIFESLYAFYYEETIYTLPTNKLMVVRSDKLNTVKEYPRTNCFQNKPTVVVTYPSLWDDTYKGNISYNFKIQYDGINYTNTQRQNMHGVYYVSRYGYVYSNQKKKESWQYEVAFFMGKLLKHPKAFALLDKVYKEAKETVTKEVELLLNMLDFNPFTEDLVEYCWYDLTDFALMIPQGDWKWPMVDHCCSFDNEGLLLDIKKSCYDNWPVDYAMFTYDEEKIINFWKKQCEGL